MQAVPDSKTLGILIQTIRKQQGLTQLDLAAAAGVGVRFIVDLEKGKPTCEINKSFIVLHRLGIQLIAEAR